MIIRNVVIDDAPRLSQINAAAWKVAYAGILPDDALDARTSDDRIAMWHDYLKPDSSESALVLEDNDDAVMAYATFGPQRDGDSAIGEIYAFYVDPDSWGLGLGRQLMSATEAALKERSFPAAVLWTLEKNVNARAFYERTGWIHIEGIRDEIHQGVRAVETQYRKNL